jgi:hypothetical protein
VQGGILHKKSISPRRFSLAMETEQMLRFGIL